MNHNTLFSKVNKFFFFILFSLGALMFFPAACDDGGEETVNADQDVKDWCEKWIHCSDEELEYDKIPYETLNGCYEVIQWIKEHKDDGEYYKKKCYERTLFEEGQSDWFSCEWIGMAWTPADIGACAWTPFGECPNGNYEQEYPQCEPE